MNLKSIKVSNVRVLGNTGNVVLEIAGLLPTQVVIKPLSILVARLEPAQQAIVRLTPSMLKGAIITTEDNDYNGVQTKASIVVFKAGDNYIANENSTEVTAGRAKVGDPLTNQKDGVYLQGNINLTLAPTVINTINSRAIDIALTHLMNNQPVASPKASVVATNDNPLDEELEKEEEKIDEAVTGQQ